MMNLKNIIIWFLKFLLFLIVLAGFVASVVSAVITVVPDSSVSKVNMLGYRSHCSFVPMSTIILVVIALVFGFIFVRIYVTKVLRL